MKVPAKAIHPKKLYKIHKIDYKIVKIHIALKCTNMEKYYFQRAFCAYCHDRIWGLGRQGFKCCQVRFLFFKFSLIPLNFSLTRETDTNKSWAVSQNFSVNPTIDSHTKKSIWHLMICQNWWFGQFYPSRIEILQNSSACFESVSLMRGKFEGTRGNLKHKNPAIV